MNAQKKILVVEDEESLRRILVDFLVAEKDFSVREAENGAVALEAIRKDPPHLVLLDIAMPVMNGVELMRKLNEEKLTQNTKVMFLTNSGELSMISSVSSEAVVGYFVKSNIDLRELLGKIRDIVG